MRLLLGLILALSGVESFAEPALTLDDAAKQLAAEKRDPDSDGPEPLLRQAIPNWGEVGPGVFRSGQPTREGLNFAKGRGVKTVLNLRLRWHDDEDDDAREEGLRTEHVRMNGIYSPTFKQVDRALAILSDPARQPVLVHCHYGKDRTGVVVSAYRVVMQGWTIMEAVEEAQRYGCCHGGFIELHGYLMDYLDYRSSRFLPTGDPARQ